MADETASDAIDRTPTVANLFPVTEAKGERRFVVYLFAITVLLASATAIFGYAISRPEMQYVGAAYNIDDNCVYFSWARQAADGHFFIRNLFTTTLQHPIQFNLLMLAMGGLARLTTLPIPVTLNICRIVGSIALLALINRLYRVLMPHNAFARLSALAFACLGSGFGWMFWPKWADKNPGNMPVDTWQPEVFTFQSINFSALFVFGMILIVAIMYLLSVARRTGLMRYAVCAGLCAAILGNIHSYDILHVGAAWLLFLIADGIAHRKFNTSAWLQAVVCGLLTIPTVAYQLYMYQVDPAFHARVLDPTLSPPFRYYVLGYGVIFLLAFGAVVHILATKMKVLRDSFYDHSAAILTVCWVVGAFAVAYAPHCSFQRKMMMGTDIPICLLAGYGLSLAVRGLKSKPMQIIAVAAAVVLSLPSTLLYVTRDLRHITEDSSETRLSPFITKDEADTLTWIRANTSPDDAILGYPEFTIFIPGDCDRYTYASHWSETPSFADKYARFQDFVRAEVPMNERVAYLRETKCRYLVFPNQLNGLSHSQPNGETIKFANFSNMPELMTPVYSNAELTVYRVVD